MVKIMSIDATTGGFGQRGERLQGKDTIVLCLSLCILKPNTVFVKNFVLQPHFANDN